MKPDRSNLKITKGDYDIKQSFALMSKSEILNDIVAKYKKHADGLKSLVFCVNIAHAEQMAIEFKNNGYKCESIHSKKKDNDETLRKFKNNEINILCNVDVLTTGFDVPDIYCIVLATPIKSIIKAVQIYGRGTRLNPLDANKKLIILDCAGVIEDTIHPLQKMDFNKKKRVKNEDKCTRYGCGGVKILVEEKIREDALDNTHYLLIRKHKCSKCDEIYISEKLIEIPISECVECGAPIDTETQMTRTETNITFSAACKSCGAEHIYREIILYDEELKEIATPISEWDSILGELKQATNKEGKKYHHKWSDYVLKDLQESGISSKVIIKEINRYKEKGWSLGGIAISLKKRFTNDN
jgi:superfamily II DNA or RNA helicase